jgi:hypothetical protein
MLIRRGFLDEYRPFYREGQAAFDVDACLRVLPRCKYGFIHDIIGWTRVHDESMTATVSSPNQTYIAEWLGWIDRYGAITMTPLELDRCRRAHLRHYFRRLLLWRFKDHNKTLFDRHIAILSKHGVKPTIWDYAKALLFWLWLAGSGQRYRVGEATSMRERAWAELHRT